MSAKRPEPGLTETFKTTLAGLDLSPAKPFVVALSGGVDSMVLLHLLRGCVNDLYGESATVEAIHINHQLHNQADDWAHQVGIWCGQFNVPLQVVRVEVAEGNRISTEAAARSARYEALVANTPDDAIIFTGQHLSDQAETVLLQLKRGAGPKGLSGMAKKSALQGERQLVRPLLDVQREAIEAWAQEQKLAWIEDHTNQDTQYDRNFLRHKIIPQIKQRWPEFEKTVARSASLCAEQQALLDSLIDQELKARLQGAKLSLTGWELLNPLLQRAILRAWIAHNGHPLPSQAVIKELQKQLLPADGKGYNLKVSWANVNVQRNRNTLMFI